MYVDLNLDAILQENANTKPQALNFVVLTQRQERNAKNRPVSPSTRRTLPSQHKRRFMEFSQIAFSSLCACMASGIMMPLSLKEAVPNG